MLDVMFAYAFFMLMIVIPALACIVLGSIVMLAIYMFCEWVADLINKWSQ